VGEVDDILRGGLTELGLAASPEQIERLLAFLGLLGKWNRVYNLTAIDRPAEMVRLHLLDSLAVSPYLGGSRVLDVGTGAGLPGIPLAILDPQREFVLLDSNAKKTRFVTQAAIQLGLSKVRVVHARVEQFQDTPGFDRVICRAFAALPDIVAQTRRLLRPGGIILALKGKSPVDEMEQVKDAEVKTYRLDVPGVDAERHVVAITVRD
jgi:16S rRNA (guanine527-N7)-methyltransferase